MKSKSVKGEMLGYFNLRESKGTQLNIHTIRHQWQKLEALFVHLIQRISNYSCTPLVATLDAVVGLWSESCREWTSLVGVMFHPLKRVK